jgi:hypothetical protein
VIVVSNSSPLICLAKIDALDLLRRLYGSLTISQDVYAEVVVSGAGRPGSFEISNARWIQVRKVTRPAEVTAAQERFGLGLGELSTLILAKEIGAELLLLDDLRARKLAQQKGAFVQGTVGILELCFRRGYLRDLREAYALLMKRVFI